MIERFVMNEKTHMGPLNKQLKPGDVISYDTDLDTMEVNGSRLGNDGRSAKSTEGFAEVVRILEKQKIQNPDNPFADILKSKKSDVVSGFAKTDTLTIFPILGCFKAAEDWLNGEQDWTPTTDLQEHFIENFIEHLNKVDALGDNLERKASSDVKEINGWLKEHGFDIQLSPGMGGDFYVASILDVLVEWLNKGDKTTIQNGNGSFEGVKLKKGVVAYQNKEIHGYPVVKILTKSGDKLCMSICEHLDDNEFSIYWKIKDLQRIQKPYNCDGVIFPMVDYNRDIDISWLKGLKTNPEGNWKVAEALQQTKFRMNEEGARAESAVAMTFRKRVAAEPAPWVVIDKPFILWIERNGIAMPLFSGTFAEDVWKSPETLD